MYGTQPHETERRAHRGPARHRRTAATLALLLAAAGAAPLAAQPATAGAGAGALAASTVRSAPAAHAALRTGERLTYDVSYGRLKVGTGVMEVRGLEEVRGRSAWHTVFTLKGGIPLYRVDDRLESWIDSESLSSLRHVKDQHEGRRKRERRYEFFPERGTFVDSRTPDEEQPSVAAPLDEGSFLYFVRTIPLEVGERYDFDRYFRPDRNPVTIHVLRRETVKVPAGTFETIVVRPVIKTKGIFSEGGQAEVWLTDDDRRMVVQMKAKLSFGSITMRLREAELP